jgi:hypothetical protein
MAKLKTATRTIHNAGGGRVIGQIPSLKNRTGVAWESLIERDFEYYLEFLLKVGGYVPQPEQTTLPVNEQIRRYTTDFLVRMLCGEWVFVEVKSDKAKGNPKYEALFEAARQHYEQQGHKFLVVYASDLRRGHLMANIRTLYYYARWPSSKRQKSKVMEMAPSVNEKYPLISLIGRVRDVGISAGVIYQLLFEKMLVADLVNESLNPQSMIWREK